MQGVILITWLSLATGMDGSLFIVQSTVVVRFVSMYVAIATVNVKKLVWLVRILHNVLYFKDLSKFRLPP